jgi:glutamate-1-semialdehyde 2,1-aminomutase
MSIDRFSQSHDLFQRAARVIPGGIYGHTSPALGLPGAFPYYAVRAEGCRYWDADGHEYIDYMCAYGPIVLGYNHPEVEEAAEKQRRDGNCFNHPTPLMVGLAEHLVNLVDFAGWAVFGKNGSDLTTWCVQVAREHTRRKKVLSISGAYHGAHAWCTPGHGGLIEEDRAHVHAFAWNDLNQFHDLIEKYRGQIAAFIAGPFHYPSFGDSILPEVGFFQEIQRVCHQEGILFILDDVRAGFRLHLGGSHRHFGFEPDLIVFCKALGNGHPISAALGRAELKRAASNVFLTGSYWNSAVPMAAAKKTLEILERDSLIPRINMLGERLMNGLREKAQRHGLEIRCTGPGAVPMMTFANETNLRRQQKFCTEAVRRGVFFHPHHNWFLCAAHREEDVDKSLAVADEAFAAVKETFGS